MPRHIAILRHEKEQCIALVDVLVLGGERMAVQHAVAVPVREHSELGVLDERPQGGACVFGLHLHLRFRTSGQRRWPSDRRTAKRWPDRVSSSTDIRAALGWSCSGLAPSPYARGSKTESSGRAERRAQ